jgi:hypothetical protein
MEDKTTDSVQERERGLFLRGNALDEFATPRLVPPGSSDLSEWRHLIEAIGKASGGGHAVNDVRAERRG